MKNIEDFPSFIVVKELSEEATFSKFIQMSTVCAQQLGWDKPENSYGSSDYDIPSKMANAASQFIELDALSLRSHKKMTTIEFQNYSSGWEGMLVERTPVLPTRVAIQAIEITKTPFFNLARSLMNFDQFYWNEKQKEGVSYLLEEDSLRLPLSQRQQECLFYLTRGKTAKQIARILGIHHRTVDTHIFFIKEKLACSTKEQLIEKAFESGFVYSIPKSLLNKYGAHFVI